MSRFIVQPHENAPLACNAGNPLCPNPHAPSGLGLHSACGDVESLNVPAPVTPWEIILDEHTMTPADALSYTNALGAAVALTMLDEIDSHPARITLTMTGEQMVALVEAANIVLGLPSHERGYKSYDDEYDTLVDARDVLRQMVP